MLKTHMSLFTTNCEKLIFMIYNFSHYPFRTAYLLTLDESELQDLLNVILKSLDAEQREEYLMCVHMFNVRTQKQNKIKQK